MLVSEMQSAQNRAPVLEGHSTAAAVDMGVANTPRSFEPLMSPSMASRSSISGYSVHGNRGGYSPAASEISMTRLRTTGLMHRDGNGDGDSDTSDPVSGEDIQSPHTTQDLVAKFELSADNSVEGSVIASRSFGTDDGERAVVPTAEGASVDEGAGFS